MKKIFISVLFAVLFTGACAEKSNLVVLDKFVPITPQTQCNVNPGGDRYYSKGYIDLAFTGRYLLGFQITNYMSSSQTDGTGATDAPISTIETNRFMVKRAEIEYEWDMRAQADGRRVQLTDALWGGTKEVEIHDVVVVDPEGGQAAAYLDIFTEAQAKDLLRVVEEVTVSEGVEAPVFDWVTSPLLVSVRIIGELSKGKKISTNTLTFSIIPSFGTSIMSGTMYYRPWRGFEDDTEEWETMRDTCSFSSPLVGGCFPGQDFSLINCHADDAAHPGSSKEWMKFVATSRCHLDSSEDCFHPENYTQGVMEVIFNRYRKSSDDDGYYLCCPGVLPPEPQEEEDDILD